MRLLLCTLLVVAVLCGNVSGYGEGSYPYNSRAFTALLNAARVDFQGYISNPWFSNQANKPVISYPNVPPLHHQNGLMNAADFIAKDNLACYEIRNVVSSNSCNGTSYAQRIDGYYNCGGYRQESMLAGTLYENPRTAIYISLCNPNATSPACRNVTNSSRDIFWAYGPPSATEVAWNSFGGGHGQNTSLPLRNIWAVELGSVQCTSVSSAIYTGSHIIYNSTVVFVATYYSGSAPTSAKVVLGGTSIDLTLALGTAPQGTYVATVPTQASGCRDYYFEFVSATGTTRYPTTGLLQTTNENAGCVSVFTAGTGTGGGSGGSGDGGSTDGGSGASTDSTNGGGAGAGGAGSGTTSGSGSGAGGAGSGTTSGSGSGSGNGSGAGNGGSGTTASPTGSAPFVGAFLPLVITAAVVALSMM